MAPLFVTLWSFLAWLGILLGTWIYTRFWSMTINYQTVDE